MHSHVERQTIDSNKNATMITNYEGYLGTTRSTRQDANPTLMLWDPPPILFPDTYPANRPDPKLGKYES